MSVHIYLYSAKPTISRRTFQTAKINSLMAFAYLKLYFGSAGVGLTAKQIMQS